MKSVVIPVVFLLLIAAVHAEGLKAVSPAEGSTMDPTNGFVFSADTTAKISSCQLLIDNETVKSVPYNDVINGKVITYVVNVTDGNHTWSVRCDASGKQLQTPMMNVVVQSADDGGVKVTGSGMFRGSMLRSFKFANKPAQQPVTITKIAAGDLIGVQLAVPPSQIKKELYVKQKSTKDGKQYVVLEDLKKGDIYTLYKGENVTINITTSRIIMSYIGDEANRATIIVYPSLEGTQAELAGQTPEPVTTPETPTEALPAEPSPEQEPAAEPTKEERKDDKQEAKDAKEEAKDAKQDVPKQGFFKRMLSWFSNVFG